MDLTSKKLINLVNLSTGLILDDQAAAAKQAILEATHLCQRMIGCTLIVRDKPFILANLELYYGGIGDEGSDWYRAHFLGSRGIDRQRSKQQELEGPAVYFGRAGNRKRMDIVIGPAGVAISVLIRNVLTPDLNSVGKDWTGNTSLILDHMGITPEDSGKRFGSEFHLLDTHSQYVLDPSTDIQRHMRFQGKSDIGFEGRYGKEFWNFTLKQGHVDKLKHQLKERI